MSSPESHIHADLAFLRSLAEDSAPALRTAGAAVALAGVVWGANALRTWALELGWIEVPGHPDLFIPRDALVAQLGLLPPVMWWAQRGRPRRRGGSAGGRAVGAALNGFGVAFTAASLALTFVAVRRGDPDLALSVFPWVLFVLNGLAWWVAFAVYRHVWMLVAALGSFAAALALGWLAGEPSQWLVLGLGLFCWVAAPGVALVRQASAVAPRGRDESLFQGSPT